MTIHRTRKGWITVRGKKYRTIYDPRLSLVDLFIELIQYLSGITDAELEMLVRGWEKDDYLTINSSKDFVERTFAYRQTMVKRQSEYSLRTFLGPAQELGYVLDDFKDQLHREIMDRKKFKE